MKRVPDAALVMVTVVSVKYYHGTCSFGLYNGEVKCIIEVNVSEGNECKYYVQFSLTRIFTQFLV